MVKGSSDVKKFEFQKFADPESGIKSFEFAEFQEGDILDSVDHELKDQTIRLERESASETNFKVMDHVENLRGLRAQAEADYESRIQKDLDQKVAEIRKGVEEAGFQSGFEAGQKMAYEEGLKKVHKQIQCLDEILSTLQQQKVDMLTNYKSDIFRLVRQFTKWFTLKEIEEDHQYLERVLEKLIYEINSQSNLIVKVNKSDFEGVPKALENVEERVGKIPNARIEIEHDMRGRGIIIESERGIIDGSINAQFDSFDKIFESVGLDGSN